MRVLIIHDELLEGARADEADLLEQVRLVDGCLHEAGHDVDHLAVGLDLSGLDRALARGPDVVFNLVESLARSGRLIDVAPALVEVRGVPYTGCPAASIATTSNKPLAKRLMAGAGVATPPWRMISDLIPGVVLPPGAWIVKSLWEHASVGLDEDCVLGTPSPETLRAELLRRGPALGGAGFAERYIDGREFNVGLLEGPHGPEILPVAEILFDGYGPDKPRVVGFRAKWDDSSFEYQHTVRRFDLPAEDGALVGRLCAVALRCWELFGLRGYARVDFRVDAEGQAWVLEVNADPCISPDAGFMAAAEHAGLTHGRVVERILAAALHRGAPASPPSAAAPVAGNRRSPLAVTLRDAPREGDIAGVRTMAEATGFFRPDEVEIAVELVSDRLERGPSSDYCFVLADDEEGRLVGYTCYGEIGCTIGSYDLYWIVVAPDQQGRGLGRLLLAETERRIRDLGGRRVYIETSSLEKYAPTQEFYLRCGYGLEARLEDFYQPGDAKLVYARSLSG